MYDNADLAALIQLNPLVRGFMPWNAGTLKPSAMSFILQQVVLFNLRSAVECGSGISTVFLASSLRSIGGRLICIEHDPAWIERTRSLLASERLSEHVELVHAPLEQMRVGDSEVMWYARASIERLLDSPLDLLLVDGPPAQDPRHRTDRYPAAGFFRPALHTDSLVVLDDVSRSGEAEIVKRWEAEQGLRLRTFEALRLAAGRLGRVGLLY